MEEEARQMRRCLLPLINLETHPFMRYMLKRRRLFISLVERKPAGRLALDQDDKREISAQLVAVAGDFQHFPFGAE